MDGRSTMASSIPLFRMKAPEYGRGRSPSPPPSFFAATIPRDPHDDDSPVAVTTEKEMKAQMMQRIAVIGCTVFGVAATSFWFITIPYLNTWNPSRKTIGVVVVSIATANLFGLLYLFRKRLDYGRWLVATGLIGNGLSLLIIIYSLAGCFFLGYLFRM